LFGVQGLEFSARSVLDSRNSRRHALGAGPERTCARNGGNGNDEMEWLHSAGENPLSVREAGTNIRAVGAANEQATRQGQDRPIAGRQPAQVRSGAAGGKWMACRCSGGYQRPVAMERSLHP